MGGAVAHGDASIYILYTYSMYSATPPSVTNTDADRQHEMHFNCLSSNCNANVSASVWVPLSQFVRFCVGE